MKKPKQDKPIESAQQPAEEEPQVFSVATDVNKPRFTRRNFLTVAAVTSTAAVVSGCGYKIVIEPMNATATTPPNLPAAPTKGQAPVNPQEAPPNATAVPTNTPALTDTPAPTNTPVPTNTPMPTDTATATTVTISASVNGSNVNLRSGPDTVYSSITKLQKGDQVTITHRIMDSSWVYITVVGRQYIGWIKTTLLTIKGGGLELLPLMEAPPTPTPLPGHQGTTSAGNTGIDYQYTDQYGNIYTYTLPCGSPIPAGAVCICNCVTVPAACSCDSYHSCTCDGVTSHYWYPN